MVQHSVPYFGEHPIVESHYLSKRSRRQPSTRRHEPGGSGLGLHRGHPDTDPHRHPSSCPIRPEIISSYFAHASASSANTAGNCWSILIGQNRAQHPDLGFHVVVLPGVCASRPPHIRPSPRRLEWPSRAMITWSWTAIPSSPQTSMTC